MKFPIVLIVAACLLFLSCGQFEQDHTNKLQLTALLPVAEKLPDSQLIVFGTPEGKKHLLSGWSETQRNSEATFQYATGPVSAFLFQRQSDGPLYLHLLCKAPAAFSLKPRLNSNALTSVVANPDEERITIPLPQKYLKPGANLVELQIESNSPPAFYHAIVTPSKYYDSNKAKSLKEDFWKTGNVSIRGKRTATLDFFRGGSLKFYERINRSSRLQFGYRYRPSSFAEEDDFAEFQVIIRSDQRQTETLFEKKLQDEETGFEMVALSYPSGPQEEIVEIELRVKRNSILNSALTSWIDPAIYSKGAGEKKRAADPHRSRSLRASGKNANVVLMVLDAASANHFGSYGYKRNTTPVSDELAAQGVLFERAYTPAVFTLASTASLMSGTFPFTHRIISTRTRLPDRTVTLAEIFQAGGYETGTFVANGNASTNFGMTQGFDEIGEVFREATYSGWGKDITNRFTKWLDQERPEKFFAYLHYREPHAPFNPPPDWIHRFVDPNYEGIKEASYEIRQKINMGQMGDTKELREYIISLYDANLAYADWEVGRVVEKLKRLGDYDNTIIIVTSDHGEAFWEHGFQGHNSQLYEESIRIPLIIKIPSAAKALSLEKRVSNKVRTIDLFPTLADWLGLSMKSAKVEGRSFLPYLVGAPEDGREIITQTILDRGYCYTEGDYKYIAYVALNKEELYNLKKDPRERNDLIEEEPIRAKYYRAKLFSMLNAQKKIERLNKTEKVVIDDSTRENLKALGYIDE